MVFGARYTDKWAVKINGGEAAARRLSEKYGFTYLGKVSNTHTHTQTHYFSELSYYKCLNISFS